MNKREANSIIRKIDGFEKKLAKTRDELDDYISSLSELKDSCEQGIDALYDAREALSQFV